MSQNDECGPATDGVGARECPQASLKRFRPKFLNDLIRLGVKYDGGYVVNERAVRHSQYLMSFGVNEDWSLELDFLNRNKNVKVFCFDPSVSKSIFGKGMLNALNDVLSMKFVFFALSLNFSDVRRKLRALSHRIQIFRGFSRFLAKENVRFYEIGISNVETACFITFTKAFELISSERIPENSIFVKMDIEQYEFRVLSDLLKYYQYINCLVIEFHDLDILWAQFEELTKKLEAHFAITHIHGNNYGALIPNSDIPSVLEITFLKRSLISEEHPAAETVTYPIPQLDYPNDRAKRDYVLGF